jgi:hypothetical protein
VWGKEIEDHWHEGADVLDTRSLGVEVGDEGSFIVERSVVVAEVGAVVFKGRRGGTALSRSNRAFEGGGRSALDFQGSEGCLDAGLGSGGSLGSSRSGRLQGGLPFSCSGVLCALAGSGVLCALVSGGLLVLSLHSESGRIRGKRQLRGHGDRERKETAGS